MKVKVYPCNFTHELEKLTTNEELAVGIESMSITYTQPPDTCSDSDDIQTITITTQCAESVSKDYDGFYFDITIPNGQHWSVSDGKELSGLIEDFKRRLYNNKKQ